MDKGILMKYEPIRDFVEAMVSRIEEAEGRYGDWRDINDESVREHLEDEIKEWQANWQSPHEMIDVANLIFMLWCIYQNPPSWQNVTKQYEWEQLYQTWPSYRYG